MSIASLTKFTVPLASDSSATAQGLLMPKLKYRFRILFENLGVSKPTTELTKQVSSASRPNLTFTNKVIDVYNSKINYAGKPVWSKINIKIKDDVTGAVSKLIGEQIQKQFDFSEQASAPAAGNYKFTMAIEMLDGGNGAITPLILERWECYGCYIDTANYETLDYKSDEFMEISISVQPDNCIQTNTGVSPAGSQRGTAATGNGTGTLITT